ncbi:MAG TPA: FAD-binding oxidoreductase [Solirubrobacteraceae bacterium]|jgi:FAD/FMN-containing dehydrogenase
MVRLMTGGVEVLVADSPGYESARRSQMARFDDVRPYAVVRCREPEHVAHALAFAQQEGLHVALRSGGHCFAGRSSTTGVVIDVSAMNEASVSEDTITVGAGARLADVYDALAAHDCTIAAGCGPTVGIAGLTLGGGLGILGRLHGLTADQLLAARVVLADGRIVDCDEQRHGDLFWALRGAGGGQFAAVTHLVLRTLPVPPATAFHLVWPWTVGAAVLAAWQAWAPDAPDRISASLVVRATANVPPSLAVFGVVLDQEPAAHAALDEFVADVGVAPTKENYEPGLYREIKRYLAEYDVWSGERRSVQRESGHSYSKSEFFRHELPAEVSAELLAHLADRRGQREARVLDFTPWAGAYNRVPADATAFAHRGERFLLKHEAVVDPAASEAERQAARDWLSRSWELVHPSGSGGVYPNFPDPELRESARAYHGANLDRLTQVKATYDPESVFRFDQSIQPVPRLEAEDFAAEARSRGVSLG